jgi:hypothetical protein
MLFILKLNEIVIAYRWGFISDNKYYDWRVSFNPEYNRYSPGIIILGLAIDELMKRGYREYSFGAGDYEWKKRWATSSLESSNFDVFAVPEKKILPKLYLNYVLKFKQLAFSYKSKFIKYVKMLKIIVL